MTIFVISGIGFVCCNSSNVVRVAIVIPPQNNQFFSSKITQLLIIIRHGDLLPQVLLVHPQPFKGKHNFLCFRMPYKLSGHTGADKFFLISKMGLHRRHLQFLDWFLIVPWQFCNHHWNRGHIMNTGCHSYTHLKIEPSRLNPASLYPN